MSTMIQGLLDQRNTLWEQAKTLLDAAEAEGRALSGEDEKTWNDLTGEIDRLDAQRKSIEAQQTRAAEVSKALEASGTKPGGQRGGDPDLEENLRRFLRGEVRSVSVANTKRVPMDMRTLKEATKATGGATVPETFVDQLYVHLVEMSAILDAGATVFNTASGEPMVFPKTKAYGTAPGIVAEAAKIPERDATFDQLRLSAYKYAELVQVSRELVDDTAVDLLGFIAMEAGWALGNALGADLIGGTGTGKPAGLVPAITAGVTGTGATGVFTLDELIDLQFSVIAPYRKRSSCGWLMADTTVGAVRKLKATDGSYLWEPSQQVGTPDRLLGFPVNTDPFVDAVGAGKKSVLFGAFNAYYVRLAGGLRFERSDEFAFDEDVVTFKAVLRADGGLIDDTGAIKAFTGKA